MTTTTCSMRCTIGNVHFTFSDVPVEEMSKIAIEIAASTNRTDNIDYDSEEYNEERIDEENEEDNVEILIENEEQVVLPIYQPAIPEVANLDGVYKFKCIHDGCLKTCNTLGEIQGHWIRMHMHERWQDLCHPVYVNDYDRLPSRRKWVCLRERCTCVRKGGFNKQRMACHLALYYHNSPFYDGR